MNIEINIDDYVSAEEKKELCIEYIRETLRGGDNPNHKERVLSNMAYNAAFKLLDEALTKEDHVLIHSKVVEIIKDDSAYGLFRKKDAWGQEDSVAYVEVKKAIEEHKHLINGLVKQAILDRDYSKDIGESSEWVGEIITDALIKGLQA